MNCISICNASDLRPIFVEVEGSFIPTSSTCTNSMNLHRPSRTVPLPTAENLHDYAFANTYTLGNISGYDILACVQT